MKTLKSVLIGLFCLPFIMFTFPIALSIWYVLPYFIACICLGMIISMESEK